MNSPALGIGHAGIGIMILLALVPIFSDTVEQSFLVALFTRVMVFAIAAAGLNIALGFGGMVSFGHAMYIGLGAYAAAVMQFHGIESALIQLLVALAVGALCALIIGLCSLRTAGVAFIMITLAFAQMFYSALISFAQYGGDEGLSMVRRSTVPGLDMEDSTVFYYLVFFVLLGCIALVSKLMGSHYGWALKGCKSNERRMAALGFDTSWHKLVAYVLSALFCVIAGFFLANLFKFASPSYA
ncbi:MAG: branched-chain amino acid ABC transporter permease, partial [Pusillimonas sp.]|nr:branched-chain amino acid ABC transporter permease [Pusillimonas sp.]